MESAPDSLSEVPLFTLNTVLFPGGLLSLKVFEPRYLAMVSDCLKREQPFGVCLIRDGGEVGGAATPYPCGTLATIRDWNSLPGGLLGITASGGRRFRIREHRVMPDQLVRARIELLEESGGPVPPEYGALVELLRRIMQAAKLTADESHFDDADWLSWRLAELLPLTNEQRQQLLESEPVQDRLHLITRRVAEHSPG